MQIKRRNMFVQVLLMIVTFGFYAIYWFYQTATEMKAIAKDESAQPGLWTALLFLPIVSLWSLYKYAELFEKAGSEKLNKWITFLLWLAIGPVVWILVQLDLNKKAETVSLPKAA